MLQLKLSNRKRKHCVHGKSDDNQNPLLHRTKTWKCTTPTTGQRQFSPLWQQQKNVQQTHSCRRPPKGRRAPRQQGAEGAFPTAVTSRSSPGGVHRRCPRRRGRQPRRPRPTPRLRPPPLPPRGPSGGRQTASCLPQGCTVCGEARWGWSTRPNPGPTFGRPTLRVSFGVQFFRRQK